MDLIIIAKKAPVMEVTMEMITIATRNMMIKKSLAMRNLYAAAQSLLCRMQNLYARLTG